jgi:hypothetical protein
MEKHITVDNYGYPAEYPNKCPICHNHGDIAFRSAHVLPENRGVEVLFECPFEDCRSYFIGYYGPRPQKELKALRPQKSESPDFSEAITQLSPNFVAIYLESEEARHLGLQQICGPGYRKAFEWLVKDYAKSLSPEKAKEIETAFSGTVVRDFVKDPRIQAVAQRALWLGNDETHYFRKWVTKDIDDLIVLVRLTINWIEIERLSEKYRGEMPE